MIFFFSFKVVLLDNILAAGHGQVPEHNAGGNGQGDCGDERKEYSGVAAVVTTCRC